MADLFVLLHAPVLGPASWAPVAAELSGRGHRVAVPSLTGFAADGPPYADHLVRLARSRLPRRGAGRTVLVVHSGAGVLAPHLAGALPGHPVAVLFADAALPAGTGPTPVADAGFLPYLEGLATAGTVPPWPQWWPPEDVAAAVPGHAAGQAAMAEAAPLPLAFFAESLPPVPPSWRDCHPGYLRFSDAYHAPAAEAARRGWPVRGLAGEHLHMLADPAGVAGALLALAEAAWAAGPFS